MNKKDNSFYKKKSSLARAFYNEKYTSFKLNDKTINDVSGITIEKLFAPIKLIEESSEDLYNKTLEAVNKIHIFTRNGGTSSQVSAARSALCILLADKIEGLRSVFKPCKLLTRDLRKSERTKPGIKGSRVRPPFNKR